MNSNVGRVNEKWGYANEWYERHLVVGLCETNGTVEDFLSVCALEYFYIEDLMLVAALLPYMRIYAEVVIFVKALILWLRGA